MPNDLKIRIHSDDPRLKRMIDHDSRSAQYKVDTSGLDLIDKEWQFFLDTLDQGDTGKCTAEAACETLGSDPFYSTLSTQQQTALGDIWTDDFYSDEEDLDGDGPFPPNDNGSSGLSSAKVAYNWKLISGYQHTFSTDDALKAIQLSPGQWGTLWKTGMDDVNETTGQVRYTGKTRGGHEMCIYKIVVAKQQVWFHQSWGEWGYQRSGKGWISFDDFDLSLRDQGDMVFYVPLSKPAPAPTPSPVPVSTQPVLTLTDDTAKQALQDFADGKHVYHVNVNAKAAIRSGTWS